MTERKVMLYIAASLDGYIAKPNDDLSFLSLVQQEGEDYGYQAFTSGVDTIIMGRKTYDWVMRQVGAYPPAADKEVYILTRTPRPNEGNVKFYSGSLNGLLAQLKGRRGKNIFIDGGAQVVNGLLQEKLIDDIYLSIVPILLGNGIRLFHDGRPEQPLKLVSAKQFQTGLVQLHYTRADQ